MVLKRQQFNNSYLFIFSKDIDAEHAMDSKSDKIKVMINDQAGEFIEELFQQLLS